MSTETYRLNMGGYYNVLTHAQAVDGSDQTYFGKRHSCRHCPCSDPAQFREVAHLIPEALGNRWLISRDECDHCNAKFSEYESHLVSALRPILTISGTAGKDNKVGQTGRTSSGSYIRNNMSAEGGRQLHINMSGETALRLGFTPNKNLFHFAYPVPAVPFKPRMAYKALAKMGYALLPDAELKHFTKLKAWLSEPKDTVDFNCLEVGLSFGIIGNAPNLVSAALLRRVNSEHHLPYMMFLMCAGSICLQIDLMSDDMENHLDWHPMGQIDMDWSIGSQDKRVQYGKFHPMNWASPISRPQPVKELRLDFNMRTTVGKFTAVYRDEWL